MTNDVFYFLGDLMARSRTYTVRVDPLSGGRMEARARALGLSLSDHIRRLIEQDLMRGGMADALAEVSAEVGIVTGVMVRRLVDHVYGDDAKAIERAASERAATIIEQTKARK